MTRVFDQTPTSISNVIRKREFEIPSPFPDHVATVTSKSAQITAEPEPKQEEDIPARTIHPKSRRNSSN